MILEKGWFWLFLHLCWMVPGTQYEYTNPLQSIVARIDVVVVGVLLGHSTKGVLYPKIINSFIFEKEKRRLYNLHWNIPYQHCIIIFLRQNFKIVQKSKVNNEIYTCYYRILLNSNECIFKSIITNTIGIDTENTRC